MPICDYRTDDYTESVEGPSTAYLCHWCREPLSEDERDDPYTDESGDAMCCECYDDEYRDVCPSCGESCDKSELGAVGNVLVVAVEEGTAPDEETDAGVPAGLYRIDDNPHYTQAVVGGGWLHGDDITRIADAPDDIDTDGYPCAHLCSDCSKKLTPEKVTS